MDENKKETVKKTQENEDKRPVDDVPEESYPPYNFSWFIEGKIAAMGWPQNEANLNYLRDVGVDHLITLSPERWPPVEGLKGKLKWTEIRVEDFGAPTLKQILKFIEICERVQLRGEVIGVHCRHGRGRTGTMLACYLVHFKDMAPERAVLTVRVQRPGSCETYEQEKIVYHYHDCMRGTIPKPDYRLVEDKVTDMMVANSSNLITTVRPANQRASAPPPPETVSRNSHVSSEQDDDRFDQDEQDEIVDLTAVTLEELLETSFPHIPSKDDGQGRI